LQTFVAGYVTMDELTSCSKLVVASVGLKSTKGHTLIFANPTSIAGENSKTKRFMRQKEVKTRLSCKFRDGIAG
jgi:hypothetical protein